MPSYNASSKEPWIAFLQQNQKRAGILRGARFCVLGGVLFLAAATARADLHLTLKRESGQEDVTISSQVAVWMLKDRVRHEIDHQVDLILRLDEQKLYLIDSRERSYTAIELRREGDGWAFKPKVISYPPNRPGMTARIEPTGQTRQIGPWKAQQQRVTLSQNVEFSPPF